MKKLYVFNLILLVFGMVSGLSHAGEREGGGGTVVAAQFTRYGSFALDILSAIVPEIDSEKGTKVIQETQVFAVSKICHVDLNTGDTTCRDAEYDANDGSINFDRTIWKRKGCQERLMLSAHEYLRALGIENANYLYSNKFFGNTFTSDLTKNDLLSVRVDNFCNSEKR